LKLLCVGKIDQDDEFLAIISKSIYGVRKFCL